MRALSISRHSHGNVLGAQSGDSTNVWTHIHKFSSFMFPTQVINISLLLCLWSAGNKRNVCSHFSSFWTIVFLHVCNKCFPTFWMVTNHTFSHWSLFPSHKSYQVNKPQVNEMKNGLPHQKFRQRKLSNSSTNEGLSRSLFSLLFHSSSSPCINIIFLLSSPFLFIVPFFSFTSCEFRALTHLKRICWLSSDLV